MPKLSKQERLELGAKRILKILKSHGTATMRTLEMKIADAGPYGQRLNPHVITDAREALVKAGRVTSINSHGTTWYFRTDLAKDRFTYRLGQMGPVQSAFAAGQFAVRLGQVLEIATYKSLLATDHDFHGRYTDLDQHGDERAYSKEEPPNYIGRRSIKGNQRLDFMMRAGNEWAGIECKNIREWIYPGRNEVQELLSKCLQLDCIPVLVARRIHPSTFFILNKCGGIVHQVYNQLLPSVDQELAAKARDKDLLGYADLRLGNEPDARLQRFIAEHLPGLLGDSRPKFDRYRDLMEEYVANGDYHAFAAKVRRRHLGQPEDYDWEEIEFIDPDDYDL